MVVTQMITMVTQMITMVTQMIMKICWSLYLVRAPCFHPEVLFTMLVFKMVGDGKLPPRIIALNRSKNIFTEFFTKGFIISHLIELSTWEAANSHERRITEINIPSLDLSLLESLLNLSWNLFIGTYPLKPPLEPLLKRLQKAPRCNPETTLEGAAPEIWRRI